MRSAASLAEHDQLHTPPYVHHVSQQTCAEAVMGSPFAQQPYQGVFDFTPMSNALPTISPHQTAYYMHLPGQPSNLPTSPPMTHHSNSVTAFRGRSVPMANHPYYLSQTQVHPLYHGGYPSQPPNQTGLHGRSNVLYYPNQMVTNNAQSTFYPQGGQYPQHPSIAPSHVLAASYTTGAPKSDTRTPRYIGGTLAQGARSQDAPSPRKNGVRGPPRKPRQSGHALWIGNLPPHTDLMALVEHVCKVTVGMESLFLISKSNCAFANYEDEPACSIAQQKLHDSKFQSVRLVSRLRRNNTVEGTSGNAASPAPGPEAVLGTATDRPEPKNEASSGASNTTANCNGSTSPAARPPQDVQTRSHIDKFFILKSLTTEDLDLSVRTGIWVTQSHNEESLNRAFQSVDNVYLIFSANKSGEYFGYARMSSQMNEDPAAAVEFAPKVMMESEADLPKAIPTDASEFAPRGKITDDSARGTIFWEAERHDVEAGSDIESETRSEKSGATEVEGKTWGKPFKLEWLSTSRLPFFRTRGLRNPWNSNREVKIARDGTELEPSVGRKLVGLFNQVQDPASFAPTDRAPLNFVPVYSGM